jgi:hypothetical protein
MTANQTLRKALGPQTRRPKGKKMHDFAVVGTHGNVSRGQMKRGLARILNSQPSTINFPHAHPR